MCEIRAASIVDLPSLDAETPMRQRGGATRRLADDEVVGVDRLGPELAGLDGALLQATAPSASRLVERVDAGVPFIGWARGPFPVSRVPP